MLTITLFTTHNATALRDIFIFTVTSSKILSTIFKRRLLRDGSCHVLGLLIGGKRKHDKGTGRIKTELAGCKLQLQTGDKASRELKLMFEWIEISQGCLLA